LAVVDLCHILPGPLHGSEGVPHPEDAVLCFRVEELLDEIGVIVNF
jgi:hypothetical protein